MLSSTRCTTVLRVRAYVTLVPTTRRTGDASEFVGLFTVVVGVAFIVSHAAWHRGFRPVASMLEGSLTDGCTGMTSFFGTLPVFTERVLC